MNVGDLCFQLKKTLDSDLLNRSKGKAEAQTPAAVAGRVAAPIRRTAIPGVVAPAAAATHAVIARICPCGIGHR